VTIAGPTEARPAGGLAVDFVVVSNRAQLSEIIQRVRDGRLLTNVGKVSTLDNAVAAFNATRRIKAKSPARRSSVFVPEQTRPSIQAAVQIGRLRIISAAEGDFGNY
jgi:hypothetical protein